MDIGDRSLTISELERKAAVHQRYADALRKMAEAEGELEAVERELSPVVPTAEVPAAEVPVPTEQPAPPEPKQTGKRAKLVLENDPSREWNPRQMWELGVERGWAKPTKDARVAIRVAMARLERREAQVTRRQDGLTYAYRWVPADSDQPAHGSNGHGQL